MVKAALLDRDGTIVVNVPYNGDPDRVQPIEGAKAALDRLRAAGVRVGILTNQSGVGRGIITTAQMNAVNERVEMLLGPFDGWFICTHAPAEDCDCRKPKPKLVFAAARAWGIDPWEIAIIGDQPSDMETAKNAGARGIKIDGAQTIAQAVDVALGA
jgi:D-glycero-D-manno-heptose 1,7-bisphosphate phosphatase